MECDFLLSILRASIFNEKLACNPYKRIDTFKIKHNFYYKNINNYSNILLKKIACIICIRMDTFKINYNFYYKNINN